MSPTPVTYTLPTQPASYSWEATDEEVASRYGVDPATIVRFDLNTSPAPPELAARLLAAGRFESPLSEYPPSDYRRLDRGGRRGVRRRAATSCSSGRAPTRSSTSSARRSCRPAARQSSRHPATRCTASSPSSAGPRVVAVPRLPEADGWALDVDAVRAAAADADVVWLCSPNNPTGLAEPRRRDRRRCSTGIAADAASNGRAPAIVVLDEAYAEFVGASLRPASARAPQPRRRPDGQQGLRAGRAARRLRDRPARDDRQDRAVPAAGLHRDGERHDRHRGAARPFADARERRPRRAASASGSRRRWRRPAGASGAPSRTSCSSGSTAPRSAAAAAETLLRQRPRPADVRRRPPARRLAPPDGPRPRRERPARPGARRDAAMTTPLGEISVEAPRGAAGQRRAPHARDRGDRRARPRRRRDDRDRDRDRLLRPPPDLVRPPRAVRPRRPGQRRPRDRRAPHRRGRRARPRLRVRRGAR